MLKTVDSGGDDLSLQLITHMRKSINEFCFMKDISLDDIPKILHGKAPDELCRDLGLNVRVEPLQLKDDSESFLSGSPKTVL